MANLPGELLHGLSRRERGLDWRVFGRLAAQSCWSSGGGFQGHLWRLGVWVSVSGHSPRVVREVLGVTSWGCRS